MISRHARTHMYNTNLKLYMYILLQLVYGTSWSFESLIVTSEKVTTGT